jgi:hypothetical protein
LVCNLCSALWPVGIWRYNPPHHRRKSDVVWISVLAGALAVAVGVIVWQRLEAPQVAPDLPLRKWVLAPTNSLNIGSPVISPSGRSQRFVLTEPSGTVRNATIQVVQNWIAEFKR